MGMDMGRQFLLESRKVSDPLKPQLQGGCELPATGAENKIWILRESSNALKCRVMSLTVHLFYFILCTCVCLYMCFSEPV